MRFLKCVALGVTALAAIQVCSAQNKFPLRSGEWEAKMSVPGSPSSSVSMLYCLNDALWEKSLTQDPQCSIQHLAITSSGATYAIDCDMKVFQMKGKVDMTFDGMEHMIAKGQIDITMNGKTTSSSSVADYHWKGATCSPNDANLRAKKQN
ncbi:MAG: DUF3617 family protein [Terracidiphilus sp.]